MVRGGGGEDADDTATDDDDGYSLDDAKFIETNDEIQADILLTNTCAICENAENKVWNRLLVILKRALYDIQNVAFT